MGTNYGNRTVTFHVQWSGAAHNNRVWIWVDYCPVEGVTPASTFSPAFIGAVTITASDGNVTTSTGNSRGFFVAQNPATVTATLLNAGGQFNWCAYGSGDPPSAAANAAGGYDLYGTPPFTINGTITENTKTFSAGTCIESITDITGNPDGIMYAVAQATITGDVSNTCPAETVVLTAAAENATTFTWYKNGVQVQSGTSAQYTVGATDIYTVQGENTGCRGTVSIPYIVTISSCGAVPGCPGLAVVQSTLSRDGYDKLNEAEKYCARAGGWLPSKAELLCLCEHVGDVPGGLAGALWTRTPYPDLDYYTYVIEVPACRVVSWTYNYPQSFRCVKSL
jgi:hypothetical protein